MIKSLILTMLVGSMAHAATGGGNDYCEQQGSQCERNYFRITNEHPYHTELLELIQAAKLPRNLKNEMLRDLDRTQVVYSDEVIKHGDLQARYEMQLQSRSVETIRDANGKVINTKELEKYELVEKLPRLGIYLNSHADVGYSDAQLKNLRVRAVTQLNPRKVIYFQKIIDKAPKNEVLKLVLHEQAHRLKALKADRSDERVIEGFARETLDYLQGRVSQASYYKTLRAFRIPVMDRFEFTDRVRIDANNYYADISVVVRHQDILSWGARADDQKESGVFLLQLSKRVFWDYKSLKNDDQVLTIPYGTNQGLRNLEQFFASITGPDGAKSLELRVHVGTETNRNEDTGLAHQETVNRIGLSPSWVGEVFEKAKNSIDPFLDTIKYTNLNEQKLPELLFIENHNLWRAKADVFQKNLFEVIKNLKPGDQALSAWALSILNQIVVYYYVVPGPKTEVSFNNPWSIKRYTLNVVISADDTVTDYRQLIREAFSGFIEDQQTKNGFRDFVRAYNKKASNKVFIDNGFANTYSFEKLDDVKLMTASQPLKKLSVCLTNAFEKNMQREVQIRLSVNKLTNLVSWTFALDGNNEFYISFDFPEEILRKGELDQAVDFFKKKVLRSPNIRKSKCFRCSNYRSIVHPDEATWARDRKGRLRFQLKKGSRFETRSVIESVAENAVVSFKRAFKMCSK